jgi:hypothetical protein
MRAVEMLLFSWLLVPVTAMEPVRVPAPLDGIWTGSRNGEAVRWDLGDDGRLRIDGRGADYLVRGDSLLVTFDPTDPTAGAETVIYRFKPEAGFSRLFVFGFDLGKRGLVLHRMHTAAPSEDASPVPPQVPPVPFKGPSRPAPAPAPAGGPTAPGAR